MYAFLPHLAPSLHLNSQRTLRAKAGAPREIAHCSVALDAVAFRSVDLPVHLSCHYTRHGKGQHFKVELDYPAFQALLREDMDRQPAISILEALGERQRFQQDLPSADPLPTPYTLLRIERLIGRPAMVRTTLSKHIA